MEGIIIGKGIAIVSFLVHVAAVHIINDGAVEVGESGLIDAGSISVLQLQNEVSSGPAAIPCNLAFSTAVKDRCCTQAMESWLHQMPVYTQLKTAQAAFSSDTDGDETGILKRQLDAATRTYQSSVAKRAFRRGIRNCLNANTPFTPPSAPTLAAKRKKAEAFLDTKKEEAKQASLKASSAAQLAAATAAAYKAFAAAGPHPDGTTFDIELHMENAKSAVADAQAKHDAAEVTLHEAKLVVQSSNDTAVAAQGTATEAEGRLKGLESAHSTKTAEFEKEMKDLEATEATKKGIQEDAEKELTKAQEALKEAEDKKEDKTAAQDQVEQSQASVETAKGEVEAAKTAVKEKEEEYQEYHKEATKEIQSTSNEADGARAVANTADEALAQAVQHREASAVAVNAAATELEKATALQVQTRSILQSAKDEAGSEQIDHSSLKTKALQATAAATKALKQEKKAQHALQDAHRFLRHTATKEEHAIHQVVGKPNMQVKTWERKVAMSDYTDSKIDADNKRLYDCIDGNKWVC
jgi:myosin heavy subunit